MRIISGKFKGITIKHPKSKIIRPLRDMVRESVFNVLEHSNKFTCDLKNKIVLDLYSGTGSFGIECLSRGAKKVVFIEKEKNAASIIKYNIEKLNLKNLTNIFFEDVAKILKKEKNNFPLFDFVFCDPPFKDNSIDQVLTYIYINKLVKKKNIVVIHRNKNTSEKFNKNFKILETKTYGISKIIFGILLF